MSQPVKLSDELVLDARLAAEVNERSIAGQVEFWAKIGRAMDNLLGGRQLLEMRRSGEVKPLSEILASVNSPEGRDRLASYLETQPYPHFEQVSHSPRLLVRIDEDGMRTVGRFVDRVFVAEAGPKSLPDTRSIVGKRRIKQSASNGKAKDRSAAHQARAKRVVLA
jgi:hypothetical protein